MSLKKQEYKERLIDKKIDTYLKTFGAVSIEGPKWVGKTWTSLNHANTKYLLDDDDIRELANIDKETLFEGNYPILIDEWNYIPSIWDAVRRKCDEDKIKGKYILTCSTTLEDEEERKKIHHSGAGRIGTIEMHPMSLYESGDSNGEVSISDLEKGKLKNKIIPKISIEKISNLIVRGGWPGNLESPDPTILPKEYIRSTLDKDINERGKKQRDRRKMQMLLRSLARNESTILNNQTIIKDIETYENDEELLKSRNTVAEYLDVLERLYIVQNQEAYSFNIRSSNRVGKASKKHFADPSLACACLNLNSKKLIKDPKTMGFMFESLVERDLQIYIESLGGNIYHYRNNLTGLEVDSILEFENGDYAAIEIKLGYTQKDSAIQTLTKFYNTVEIKPKFMCIIYGVGQIIEKDQETGIYIIPVTTLKP